VYRVPLAVKYAGSTSTNGRSGYTQSVLIIRGDGGIGDFVLFLPALKALRQHFAGSRMALLVGSESEKIASAFADVDEVISFEVRRYRLNLAYRIRLIRQLRSHGFDIALNPIYSREPLTDELLYCSGAKQRIAFEGNLDNIDIRTKTANNAYFTRVIDSQAGRVSEIERNRQFVERLTAATISGEESLPRISLSDAQLDKARQLFRREGLDPETERLVVLFPGASHAIKQWPAERFAELANRIAKTYDTRILICGAPSDRETQELVTSKVSAPVVHLAGKTDLLQLAAVLKQSALYIGNDTGPLHLAAAVGTPTLCILGGGHFGRFYPYGDQRMHRAVFHELECFHCNWACPYEVSYCIHEITVDEVWQSVKRMFDEVLLAGRGYGTPTPQISGTSS
jgi:ADP-heptose:LPS heptosyltransferase